MAVYVLRLAKANRSGTPTVVQLLGPFSSIPLAKDWSSHHLNSGVPDTLRMTVVELDDPTVSVETPRTVW